MTRPNLNDIKVINVWPELKVVQIEYNNEWLQYFKTLESDIEYNVTITAKSDVGENNIINLKSEVKKWLTPRINIFGLYKHEYYNEKEDFQFKVGLGVKL